MPVWYRCKTQRATTVREWLNNLTASLGHSLTVMARLILVLALSPAHAQTLDLGGGSAPVVDASTASSELASFLTAQADEIDAVEDASPGLRASAAVRRLAAAMLASGQALGTRAAPRLVLARTIVTNLAALDAAFDGPVAVITPARAGLVAEDCARLAANLPTRRSELDRTLRDAFAPLTNAAGVHVPAWPVPGGAIAAAPETALAALVEAPPERVAILSGLDHLLVRARSWPSHEASARRTDALVRDAVLVLDVTGWLEPTVRSGLARSFDDAAASLLDPLEADRALLDLERLGAVARLLGAVESVEPASLRRRVERAVGELLASFETDPGRVGRAAVTSDELLRVADDEGLLERERLLPTFARVAWRNGASDWRKAHTRLVGALIEQMDGPDPMTEPAMLSAIRAHRQAARLLFDISAIGSFLTGVGPGDEPVGRGRPKVLKDRRLLGSTVLDLGKAMADEDTGGAARAQLTAIAALVRAATALEHEQAVRDAAGEAFVAAATGGDVDRLFDALDDLHAQAMSELKMQDPAGPDSDAAATVSRAEALEGLLEAIDAGRVLASDGPARLGPWAAWELTDHGWALLLDELPARLSVATGRVLEGEELDTEAFAVIRLAAHYARQMPTPPDNADPLELLLAQVALGVPPRGAIGVDNREPIAAICRDQEERASAMLRSEGDRADTLETRANRTAVRLLEVIESRAGR
jgi:hypothetical protein